MRRTAAVALTLASPRAQSPRAPLSRRGATSGDAAAGSPRDVMFVGNNWDGTATVVDARTHRPIRTLNMIPDRAERMAEILTSPDKLAFYLAVQQGVGEGHDQYTDDMFTTHDGRMVAVSRPSFADVVGIDLATRRDPVALPDGGLPRRPHGRLARRHAAAGQRLDGQQGARARHPHRREAARVPQRRHPAREQLHRATASGSSTPASAASTRRTDRARPSPRHRQGRAGLPDRRNATFRSSRAGTWARSSPRPATRA